MHTRPAFIPYRAGTLGILPESLPNKTDLFYIYRMFAYTDTHALLFSFHVKGSHLSFFTLKKIYIRDIPVNLGELNNPWCDCLSCSFCIS